MFGFIRASFAALMIPRVELVQRQAEHDNIDHRQQVIEPIGRPKRLDARRFIDREHVGRQHPHVEGGQQLGKPPPDAAETNDAHGAAGQVAGGAANELLLLLGAKNLGRLRHQAVTSAIVCSAT